MMTPEHSPSSLEGIEATAAVWLSLRDRGMTSEETAAFVQWLQQDGRHAETFDELARTWQDFDRLAALPEPVAASPDADLLAPRVRVRHPRTPLWSALGVAAAAVLVLFGVLQFRTPNQTVETVVGAFQKLDLPDGSSALLNTDTAIETTYTATQRHVRVVRGEAFFSVAKDPARPFIVTAGQVAVRAVGTAFNVRHRASAVEVFVTEGQVSVDDVRRGRSVLAPVQAGPTAEPSYLAAGERAVVSLVDNDRATTQVEKMSALEIQRALAWQERRLEFESTPLAEIVSEFNRYNRRRLVVEDAQLASKRFSGTFRADGYESFVRLLESDFDVTVVKQGDALILRAGP